MQSLNISLYGEYQSDRHELSEALLTREGRQYLNRFGVTYLNVNMEVRIKKYKISFERKHKMW
jgi:hypothetical protein